MGIAALVSNDAFTAAANSQVVNSTGLTIVLPSRFKEDNAQSSGTVTRSSFSSDDNTPWWHIFHDGALETLELEAITANQDLRQSIARVMEARAEARIAAASFFPALNLPLQATRQRTTNTGPVISSRLVGNASALTGASSSSSAVFDAQALSAEYNDFDAELSLSYEVDVFGRIRDTYGQAAANARASAVDRQAIQLSLTSQVAANYFSLRALDSEVAILQRTARLRADAVQIQQERVKAGNANDMDLSRAQLELANTEADLSDAIQRRAESENDLAVLCGQPASDFHIAPKPLDEIHPPALPVAIPAQLLTQRPDLIEARLRLVASNEGVGAARAELFPTFNIAANYGYESAEFGQLLENQSREWSITGGVSIPIFEGGRNAAKFKAARAQRDEAFGDYQQTALTAFEEAENALSALRERASEAADRARATESAGRVLEASQESYQEGAIDYFEVIDAQRELLNAQVSQVQTLNTRYAATIDLIRAMGGCYGGAADQSTTLSNRR
jgi:multidrug efflux system outer membrane protein